MTTWKEFRSGYKHHVNYGEIGNKIIESKEPEDLWKWVESQNFSEFEKGIVVGLMQAWIEIYIDKNNFEKNKNRWPIENNNEDIDDG